MIRLNDINKTVISETKIKGYEYFNDVYYDDGKRMDRETINFIFTMGGFTTHYVSKELRDKDIELLDKIFDVKSIEDKANEESKPSYDFGEPVECEPNPKEEKYLTWKDVKQYATMIKVMLPNGETHIIRYDDDNDRIEFGNSHSETYNGCIYDEDLFNALLLKKVE